MRYVWMLVLCMLVDCTPSRAALDSGGAYVHVVSAVQAGPVESCQYLGPVRAIYGANFQSLETNAQNTITDLRNKAAQMGGTHVVVDNPRYGDAAACREVSGGFMDTESGANNCVSQTGNAYRCPTEVGPRPPAAAVAAPPPPTPGFCADCEAVGGICTPEGRCEQARAEPDDQVVQPADAPTPAAPLELQQ